jgi:hypothetical protein
MVGIVLLLIPSLYLSAYSRDSVDAVPLQCIESGAVPRFPNVYPLLGTMITSI